MLSWGKGEDGQLGHGLADQLLKPAQIMALKGKRFKQVVCGACVRGGPAAPPRGGRGD